MHFVFSSTLVSKRIDTFEAVDWAQISVLINITWICMKRRSGGRFVRISHYGVWKQEIHSFKAMLLKLKFLHEDNFEIVKIGMYNETKTRKPC